MQLQNGRPSDCTGRLPKEMKRGVLSEDAVWNLLEERDEVESRLNRELR